MVDPESRRDIGYTYEGEGHPRKELTLAEKWTLRAIGELGRAFPEDLDESELRLARGLAKLGIVATDYVERPERGGRWRYAVYSLSGGVAAKFSPSRATFLESRAATHADMGESDVGKNNYAGRGNRNLKRKHTVRIGI